MDRDLQEWKPQSMESTSSTELRQGDRVHFAIDSVFLPSLPDVLAAILPADHIVGTITQFSGSGAQERAFAVVALASHSSVVVPLDDLSRVEGG
jgi:hypothetical protein